jgi:SAM-dependent methyltransferase
MSAVEWFRDYPRHYKIKPDDSGAEEAAFIRQALHLRAGDSVLDAPCGAGRISIRLALAGMRVTGVDLTPSYVERARRRFAEEGAKGEFIVSDLRAIDWRDRFRGAFNWQGSFGFFSEEDNLDVVRRYARSLRRGGRLLIDQPGREWLLRHFRARGRNGDIAFAARWNPRIARMITRFREARSGESWSMTIRFYTPAQFEQLFRQAGLELEDLFCDLQGRPYRRGARRLYVVARKP